MFYTKIFKDTIHLNPSNIGGNIDRLVKTYLNQNVEGGCTRSGYTIAVLKIINISEGVILMNGYVRFRIEYEALVLNPVKNEIIEAFIVSTNKMGYFAAVGPLSIFISTYQIPQEISSSLNVNDRVRLRIIGTKADLTSVYAIGTLNDEQLGIIHT